MTQAFNASFEEAPMNNYSYNHSSNSDFTDKNTLINQADEAWLVEVEKQVFSSLHQYEFTLETLSSLIYLCPRQIRRRLKKMTGLTFAQYLKIARFQTAERLIEMNEVSSIQQLAYKVGRRDVKYFSQQFKEYFGVSFSAYIA